MTHKKLIELEVALRNELDKGDNSDPAYLGQLMKDIKYEKAHPPRATPEDIIGRVISDKTYSRYGDTHEDPELSQLVNEIITRLTANGYAIKDSRKPEHRNTPAFGGRDMRKE